MQAKDRVSSIIVNQAHFLKDILIEFIVHSQHNTHLKQVLHGFSCFFELKLIEVEVGEFPKEAEGERIQIFFAELVLTELELFDTFANIFVVDLKFGQNQVKQNPRFDHFEIEIVLWLLFEGLQLFLQKYYVVFTSDYLHQRLNILFQHPSLLTPHQLYYVIPDHLLIRKVVVLFVHHVVILTLALWTASDARHSVALEVFVAVECIETIRLFPRKP